LEGKQVKTRILFKDGYYYPQVRKYFFWPFKHWEYLPDEQSMIYDWDGHSVVETFMYMRFKTEPEAQKYLDELQD
jgi:hypothetical protein